MTVREAALRHIKALPARGYSPSGLAGRRKLLLTFALWCKEQGRDSPAALDRRLLVAYHDHIHTYQTKKGKPLKQGTRALTWSAVSIFCAWLVSEGLLLESPTRDLTMKRTRRALPNPLTEEEVQRVLAQPDVHTDAGLRDRALLEVLYSTGLRRKELAGLRLYDLDMTQGVVMVRAGKNDKDRMVPIGERALHWVKHYLHTVRPGLDKRDAGNLFVTCFGTELTPDHLMARVRLYVKRAGIKQGACHLFRHAMATHMLEHGADTRSLQEMLGHEELTTTQIYTHVSIGKLKEVHSLTHPAETKKDQQKAQK